LTDYEKATKVFENPPIVNLICIAALNPSFGYYTLQQIDYLFSCAYTAFIATIVESKRSGFEV
jgi:hypothetical protein